ncbi:MAG: hypothetical protein ACP5E2_01560 [Terracidiphilus sp.]
MECPWKALRRELGSASAIHQYFQNWQRAGFFDNLWQSGLAEYDGMRSIAGSGSASMGRGARPRFRLWKHAMISLASDNARKKLWPNARRRAGKLADRLSNETRLAEPLSRIAGQLCSLRTRPLTA